MRHAGLIAALVVAAVATPAHAGNGNANGYDNGNAYGHDKGGTSAPWSNGAVLSPEGAAASSDQNIALSAVEAGEALPLSEIVKRVRSLFSARVLDARLVQRRARLIYRLTILTDAGLSRRVEMDAKTGTAVRSR